MIVAIVFERSASMKATVVLVGGLLLLSLAVWAQDADYQGWMKANNANVASLRMNLQAKSGDAAAADAKKLQDTFAQVHAYWQKKNVSDAMQFAMDAENGFKDVGQLAAAGKFDEASAALMKTQANCAGCHMAHRERAADGSFKMK
jgi:hypothetical protein